MKYISLIIFLAVSTFAFGQDGNKPDNRSQNEKISDPYLPRDSRSINTKANSYRLHSSAITNSSISTIQINTDVNGNNITLDAANEPNLAISPANPNIMVAGWRQFDNVQSNFRQAGFSYSNDGGVTWAPGGVIEPGIFHTDPVLDCDSAGNLYYNSLHSDSFNNFSCKVFKSISGGTTWDTGTYAFGGDKQWMYIDKGGVGINNTYSFWTTNASSCAPGNFNRSTNAGLSYDTCEHILPEPMMGTMDMDNTGALYVGGALAIPTSDSCIVLKCNDPTANISSSFWTWKKVFTDGRIVLNEPGTINSGGLIGQVNIAIDQGSSGSGNIYIAASVDRVSNSDHADVMFCRSTDGGQNWSYPVRINDDTNVFGKQWLATLSVAPNGRIDCIWLDTRQNPSVNISALCYSYSYDQGNTWSANEILSASFNPNVGYPNQMKMGDYFDMISDNLSAHLVWANTLNGEEDVYYSIITPPLFNAIIESPNPPVTLYPNPSSGIVRINSLALIKSIDVVSVDGSKVMTKLISDHSTELDLTNLSRGIYFLDLHLENNQHVLKKVILTDGAEN
jgi:hypothetical protein